MNSPFFDDKCRDYVDSERFGIIDDCDEPEKSAYLSRDKKEESRWDAIINNPKRKGLIFYAIDGCIIFHKDAAKTMRESTCDAALINGKKIHFIEIKKRGSSGWLGKACNQLINTIMLFRARQANSHEFAIVAHVANSLRPKANAGCAGEIARFKSETGGCNLKVGQELNFE